MRHLIPLLAAAASILTTAPAHADLGDQLFKLLADDGAGGDGFGRSVGLSGTTAIAGASSNDGKAENSGAAYLFDTSTGRQLFKLLPNDGAAQDGFGFSVAISGATAIVGAWQDDDNGKDSGSAYLFDITDPSNPTQTAKLLSDDGAADDWFGFSVAISGTTAIVGALRDNGGGFGAAYLFDTTTGRQLFKLLPDDGAQDDGFGKSVAISGITAIVGAYQHDDNGSAYLFDTTTGQQIVKLLADDGAAGDNFGWSVTISETAVIVGASGVGPNGSAYLFDITDPVNPMQIVTLQAKDGAAGDGFGFSVGINGTTAIVGARGDDDNGFNAGSAYLFDTITGQQLVKLLPNDGAALDGFGGSVAICGALGNETAIVGANQGADELKLPGKAYLFDAAATGTCPWDLDGSGSVGASDLLTLLATWGPCKGCPADFDNDGSVGASDLLALLVNWGPCP